MHRYPFNIEHGDTLKRLVSAIADWAAQWLNELLRSEERVTLILSGGATPKSYLAELFFLEVPWSRVTLTLCDERWVPSTSPLSNEGLIRSYLAETPAAAATFVGLTTTDTDPVSGSQTVERRLSFLDRAPSLAILGMGTDGHIASLFPNVASANVTLTRVIPVMGAPSADRISLSQAALLRCRAVALPITSAEKWRVLAAAWAADTAPTLPAPALLAKLGKRATVFLLDQA